MKVAIYCRLSKEDTEKQLESESIQNQKALLLRYALEQGWDVYHIYCDEDYSGADRQRPAFLAMLAAAEAGEFQIILVKTQSRFTRDLELVERYLHGKFPEWGVRFVALLDHIDTALAGNKKARQINGLVNEWYLEDLSENIRAVFDQKRREGQFIGSFAAYGYRKDPQDHNKLLIDVEAAAVVRRIFALCQAGLGRQEIAKRLNAAGIPNPTCYKQQQGLHYVNSFQQDDLGLWNRTTVGRILKNPLYTGQMVQGKRKKASYKSSKLLTVPEEQWVTVPGTHPAIISAEAFQQVQQLLAARTKAGGQGEPHVLAGLVYCADCGSVMHRYSNSGGRAYLRCKLYARDRARCSSHSLRLDQLEALIWQRLRVYIGAVYPSEKLQSWLQTELSQRQGREQAQERQHYERELQRRERALRELYLDKAQGLIGAQQFGELNVAFLRERKELTARLAACAGPDEVGAEEDFLRRWQAVLAGERLPRALAALLIKRVEVGVKPEPGAAGQDVRIFWRF